MFNYRTHYPGNGALDGVHHFPGALIHRLREWGYDLKHITERSVGK